MPLRSNQSGVSDGTLIGGGVGAAGGAIAGAAIGGSAGSAILGGVLASKGGVNLAGIVAVVVFCAIGGDSTPLSPPIACSFGPGWLPMRAGQPDGILA